MKIDKEKLRIGIWYEDKDKNVIPCNKDTGEPQTELEDKAYTYHTCFPLEITEHIRLYHSPEEKRKCKHKKRWRKKDRDLIKGYKGRTCQKCGCSQVRKWWQPWGRKWDEGTNSTPLIDFHTSIGRGNQDVVLAMVNSGDYTLAEALVIFSNACERCMNVLAWKYLDGKDGYEEYSDEWKKANTVCEFCREESDGKELQTAEHAERTR